MTGLKSKSRAQVDPKIISQGGGGHKWSIRRGSRLLPENQAEQLPLAHHPYQYSKMASPNQTITLITGGNSLFLPLLPTTLLTPPANSGIGYQIAAQLLTSPTNHILLGHRSPTKGTSALSSLTALNLPGTVSLVHLDVSSPSSITAAAETISQTYPHIDALVNNAAIVSEEEELDTYTRLTNAFATNTTGPACVVEAFTPLLARSEKQVRIVNVSSGAGSISLKAQGKSEYGGLSLVAYRVSKAALNMLTVCQARTLGERGWRVFCVCPGFTESALMDFVSFLPPFFFAFFFRVLGRTWWLTRDGRIGLRMGRNLRVRGRRLLLGF
jgi:NAD(P)-dependent dehydrogenase (short-subunit alcohol dehydrogenase family)